MFSLFARSARLRSHSYRFSEATCVADLNHGINEGSAFRATFEISVACGIHAS